MTPEQSEKADAFVKLMILAGENKEGIFAAIEIGCQRGFFDAIHIVEEYKEELDPLMLESIMGRMLDMQETLCKQFIERTRADLKAKRDSVDGWKIILVNLDEAIRHCESLKDEKITVQEFEGAAQCRDAIKSLKNAQDMVKKIHY